MGFTVGELRELRAGSIGSENSRLYEGDEESSSIMRRLGVSALPKRKRRLICAYIADMRKAIREVARILVPDGRAIYVIGENTIKGVYVKNATMLSLIAVDAGLKLVATSRRPLPPNRRYLPPPSRGEESLDTRMRTEIVLHFKKPHVKRAGRRVY
jgi:hypothetical protein